MRTIFMAGLALLVFVAASQADPAASTSAQSGLALASSAARSWAGDATLIYLENDEAVASGHASRWGYLFYSPTQDRARAYSVGDDEIVTAVHLSFHLDAPPVDADWIDSDVAWRAAEDHGGREFCEDEAGHLRTMLLMRGAFHYDDPNRTTWTFVYDSPSSPSLFVVVDAGSGKVVRTWKG